MNEPNRGWRAAYEEEHRRFLQADAELAALHAAERKEVWYWQGDGHDFPESLTCHVVMSADTLRSFLAAKQPETVAWLYRARQPGRHSEHASVSDHDAANWPYDVNGWLEETRAPLGIIGEPVVTWDASKHKPYDGPPGMAIGSK